MNGSTGLFGKTSHQQVLRSKRMPVQWMIFLANMETYVQIWSNKKCQKNTTPFYFYFTVFCALLGGCLFWRVVVFLGESQVIGWLLLTKWGDPPSTFAQRFSIAWSDLCIFLISKIIQSLPIRKTNFTHFPTLQSTIVIISLFLLLMAEILHHRDVWNPVNTWINYLSTSINSSQIRDSCREHILHVLATERSAGLTSPLRIVGEFQGPQMVSVVGVSQQPGLQNALDFPT